MPRQNQGPKLARGRHGVWEIRWTENRRSRSRSTGEQDYRFAQKVLANFILALDRLEPAKSEGLLIREILGDPALAEGRSYWHSHVLKNLTKIQTPRWSIQNLLPHFGSIRADELRDDDAERYLAKRLAGTIGKPAIAATVRRELGTLNAAVNWAAKNRLVAKAYPVTLPPGGEAKDRWLTHAEADRLLAATERNKRLHLFTLLAMNTAARQGAIRSLQWMHVDLDHRLIRFDQIPGPKTKKRRVPVPISDALLPALEAARDEPYAYVLGHDGDIGIPFKRACKRAGLSGVTPHTLRHTWATWKCQEGWDLWKVAGVLGDTIQTVINVYAHHCPEHLRDVVNPRNEQRNAPESALKIINNDQHRPEKAA